MKRSWYNFTIAMLILALGHQSLALADNATTDLVERGRYLATAADCVACHTAPGGVAFAGGRPLDTPFGIIYSRNLTPDRDTGLGLWSDEDFYRAMHKGLSRDGTHLYPAFPYTYFTRISRADCAAIKSFLATLTPTKNVTPANEFPWPLKYRGLMVLWNLLFFREGVPYQSSTTNSVAQTDNDRGAYLVETLGHCGACHTPKNFLGADKTKFALQGGEIQNWFAPNTTGDQRSGLGTWSDVDIVEYLQTGRNVHGLATGPMAEVVENSTSKLNATDLQAMANYLKHLPGAGLDTIVTNPDPRAMTSGEAIFIDACAGCHQASGEGSPRAFASLKGSSIVQSQNAVTVIRVILQGARASSTDARPTPFTMPEFAWKLTDIQVANVVTYIRNAWGNLAPPVTERQVLALRSKISQEAAADTP